MKMASSERRPAWPSSAARDGIRVPDPIILPNPSVLFARRADRLERLAQDHPMADWLGFMARLSRAQHAATSQAPAPGPLDPDWISTAVTARRPPLAATEHRRHPVWRRGLDVLLETADEPAFPDATRRVSAVLRAYDPDALEALADGCLEGRVATEEAGAALFVGAALQLYFTRIAACMSVSSLRVLERRGLCPVCGHVPVSSVVTATGLAPGTRFLHCALCATAWNHMRAVCTVCGGSRSLALHEIEGSDGAVKAETCGDCQSYLKVLYEAKQPRLDPVADDLATVGLDLLVGEGGWSRYPSLAGAHL
jgi:FdhE protein